MAAAKTNSRTVADTIVGEHEHTICGYSLLKGIGDGEPVASERFNVGGHDWVLLFYPDGKKSSSSEHHNHHVDPRALLPPPAQAGEAQNANAVEPRNARDVHVVGQPMQGQQAAPPPAQPGADIAERAAGVIQPLLGAGGHVAAAAAAANAAANAAQAALAGHPNAGGGALNFHVHVPAAPGVIAFPAAPRQGRRNDSSNEYCALFVALIGEGPDPQGVISTTDGKVVRAFHRFTLVDQKTGRDITKGRHREDGAVKISCARQDPNARNCHGYRKFVKKSVLEDVSKGFLVEDRIVIRYTIELVVSQGGALTNKAASQKQIDVPPMTIGSDFTSLLSDTESADITFRIVPEEASLPSVSMTGSKDDDVVITNSDVMTRKAVVIKAHKLVLQARSPVFRTMFSSEMREGETGEVTVNSMLPDVFKVLLHFIYSDDLPEDLRDNNMDVTMAQHLLMASDRYQLNRLRCMCEKRLCETLDVETVATTLMLAEKSNAPKLQKACLTFVAGNLPAVLQTEEYKNMMDACPTMVNEILSVVAEIGNQTIPRPSGAVVSRRPLVPNADEAARQHARRVRQRRENGEGQQQQQQQHLALLPAANPE